MGEAKRRKELGLPPKENKINSEQSNNLFYLLKNRIKRYPYIGVVTMAIGVLIFLVSGGLNTIWII